MLDCSSEYAGHEGVMPLASSPREAPGGSYSLGDSTMVLRIKDWSRFQHYKHRRPPWIRLHRSLLEDPTWHSLPLASRALAPMLWLLASETQEGKIDLPSETLA